MTASLVFLQQHSALAPASAEADRIARLTWWLTAVAVVVCVLVIAAAFVAVWRRRDSNEDARSPERQARARRAIIGATIASVVIAFGTLAFDFGVGRGLHHPASDPGLSIRITGHQWWWEVEYEDPIPQNRIRTANELHIPVGRHVVLKLQSTDVIHSFWVPNLGGKRDLIPGHPAEFSLRATREGQYR